MRRFSLSAVAALAVPAFFSGPEALAQRYDDDDYPAAIALFSEENFYGDIRDVFDPFVTLKDIGFNDKARSVAVFAGQWELCEHRNFTGRCVFITEDVSDLGWFGLAGRVTAVRPIYEYTEARHGLMFSRDKYGYIRYANNEVYGYDTWNYGYASSWGISVSHFGYSSDYYRYGYYDPQWGYDPYGFAWGPRGTIRYTSTYRRHPRPSIINPYWIGWDFHRNDWHDGHWSWRDGRDRRDHRDGRDGRGGRGGGHDDWDGRGGRDGRGGDGRDDRPGRDLPGDRWGPGDSGAVVDPVPTDPRPGRGGRGDGGGRDWRPDDNDGNGRGGRGNRGTGSGSTTITTPAPADIATIPGGRGGRGNGNSGAGSGTTIVQPVPDPPREPRTGRGGGRGNDDALAGGPSTDRRVNGGGGGDDWRGRGRGSDDGAGRGGNGNNSGNGNRGDGARNGNGNGGGGRSSGPAFSPPPPPPPPPPQESRREVNRDSGQRDSGKGGFGRRNGDK
jgi:hypothetical protein